MKLYKAWCKETCHPSYRDKWSPHNPAVGQCLVTALCVQDKYGGDIWSVKVGRNSHFVNVIDGALHDLTISQFFNGQPEWFYPVSYPQILYRNPQKRNREDLLKNKDTKERYLLLKSRLDEGGI